MHYYYGSCPECAGVTYRWPAESVYRHTDTGSIECPAHH